MYYVMDRTVVEEEVEYVYAENMHSFKLLSCS